MSRSRFLHASAFALLALATPVIAAAPAAKPELGSFGFDTTGMDRSVSPGTDWVRFTNGHYNSTVEIPADRTSYGMFTKLRDLSQERTRSIIETTAKKGGAAGSNAQKVGDYYASYMDGAGIEAKGIAPLKPMLDGIAAINDRSALATQIGTLSRDGVDMPIGSQIIGDLKNPDVLSSYIGQSGLGLNVRLHRLAWRHGLRTQHLSSLVGCLLRLPGFLLGDEVLIVEGCLVGPRVEVILEQLLRTAWVRLPLNEPILELLQ